MKILLASTIAVVTILATLQPTNAVVTQSPMVFTYSESHTTPCGGVGTIVGGIIGIIPIRRDGITDIIVTIGDGN